MRVIINISDLSPSIISNAIEASIDAGVEGIQTSNGFSQNITNADIIQLKKLTKGRCSIKAVGGIKTLPHAIELIEAGANYIGTSFGRELMQELRE